jgi:hypothetical protein
MIDCNRDPEPRPVPCDRAASWLNWASILFWLLIGAGCGLWALWRLRG